MIGQRGIRFVEKDRIRGPLLTGFLDMFAIVEAEANDLTQHRSMSRPRLPTHGASVLAVIGTGAIEACDAIVRRAMLCSRIGAVLAGGVGGKEDSLHAAHGLAVDRFDLMAHRRQLGAQ